MGYHVYPWRCTRHIIIMWWEIMCCYLNRLCSGKYRGRCESFDDGTKSRKNPHRCLQHSADFTYGKTHTSQKKKQCTLEIMARCHCVSKDQTSRGFWSAVRTEWTLGSDSWISLGIFIVNGSRGSRPWRHPLVDLVEIFRLRESTDLVRRRVCTQHYK